ncbi:MAG: murein biosynthesis integral membrane protein MurJ [Desulfosporosinus sp.]|nr:murein biosynthesis integral membrane protein MurJ [Desulfosporosinus sp.]
MSTQKFIARNALMVASIIGMSTILGLTRESSIAYMFGASGTTDAYLVASIIPTFFAGTLSGSLTSTFITVYAGYLARGEEGKAWRTANIIFSFFILLLGAVGILFFVFTPTLVHLFAPSYAGNRLNLTVELSRIMMPNLIFSGLLGILVGINNAHHSFIAPSSIGLISNVFIIGSIFTLGRTWGIYGLAAGATLGVLSQFLLQLPSARKHGFHYRFLLDWGDSGVREIFTLVTPFIVSAMVGQVNLIVDRTLATGLLAGRVSALYFASKLVLLPQTIFTGAVSMVVYPLLVNAAALEDWPRLVEGLNRAIRLLLLVIYPAVVGLYVLRVPLVELLFQHGVFDAADTMVTAQTVPYLLGVLFTGSFVAILVNVYFALKKMVVAVGTGVIALFVNIALSLILVRFMQQQGLALANSLSGLTNLVLLFLGFFVVLKLQKKTRLPYRAMSLFVVQVGVAGSTMGVAVYFVNAILGGRWTGLRGLILSTVFSVLAGLGVYLLLAYVLRVEEVRKGIQWGIRKLGRWTPEREKIKHSGLGQSRRRKNHGEIRIIGWTVLIAVVIILACYLFTNRGLSQRKVDQTGPAAVAVSKETQMNQIEAPVKAPLNSEIVAVGDSFTYGNPFGPEHSWTKGLAGSLGVVVLNHGRVGQTSKDVLAHFEQDVLAEKPGRVIIFVGDGDAIKGISLLDYQTSIKTMVEKVRAHDIIPILSLPVPYQGFESRIKIMRNWLSGYTQEEKIKSLDFATVLFDSQGRFRKGMSGDGKYPSLQGYQAMGKYATQALGDK